MRIYHHYKLWEDYRAGFYDNCSGAIKKEKMEKVKEMFNSEELTIEYMRRVIDEWTFSCEQNFTNPSINKIAYLGQGACCLYDSIPSTVTMECWSKLDIEVQNRANKNAEMILQEWKLKNKRIQLCLSLD